MAKVKLNLSRRDDQDLKAFAETHVSRMTDNDNYPTPSPSEADFAAGLTAFSDKLAAHNDAQQAALLATQEKDMARAALEALLTGRGNHVEEKSGGDEGKILSSGFAVQAPGAPIGALSAPGNFLAVAGRNPGEVDLSWDPVRGAKSYVVECKDDATYVQQKVSTKSKVTMSGMTSGETYTFRVKAVGAAGESPWSDISTRLVP